MTRFNRPSCDVARYPNLLRPQRFDTEVLGAPVANLVLPDGPGAEDALGRLSRLVDDWRREGLWLVSCRIDVGRSASEAIHRDLLAAGFRHIETLVTFTRPTAGAIAEPVEPVSRATPAEIPACMRIAHSAFTESRYHLDPLVDDARAADLKAAWARNSIEGRADACLVVRRNGAAIGFVFCLRADDAVVIDLIAVDSACQRQGVGRSLVTGVLSHYRDRVDSVKVGTQAENPTSLAFYRGLGFAEVSRARTYHWLNIAATPNAAALRSKG